MTAPSPTQQQEDRRRRPLLLWLGAVAVVVLLSLGAVLILGGEGATSVTRPGARASETPEVAIDDPAGVSSGEVSGTTSGTGRTASALGLAVATSVRGDVAPGAAATLVVTVLNPTTERVLLTSAVARVTGTSDPACRRSWYRIAAFEGGREIAPAGTAELTLPVTFLDAAGVNQDSCKGASYRYSVDVRGRQA